MQPAHGLGHRCPHAGSLGEHADRVTEVDAVRGLARLPQVALHLADQGGQPERVRGAHHGRRHLVEVDRRRGPDARTHDEGGEAASPQGEPGQLAATGQLR